jgi:hypothetical protein
VCLALNVGSVSGMYAFLEVGRSKEHVRSVLLSHTMSGIIVRELQMKRTFSGIIVTNEEKRKEHGSVQQHNRASNWKNAWVITII